MANDSDTIGDVIERAAASTKPRGDVVEAMAADYLRQIEELHAAVAELKRSVSRISRGATIPASEAFDEAVREVEATLKRNVFASVGTAALLGYVWGRFR